MHGGVSISATAGVNLILLGKETNVTVIIAIDVVVPGLAKASPYFQGLLNAQRAGMVAVPFDLKHLFQCLHSRTEYKLWETTWRDLLKDALPSLLEYPDTAVDSQGDEITLKHLMGEGDWATAAKQHQTFPGLSLKKLHS